MRSNQHRSNEQCAVPLVAQDDVLVGVGPLHDGRSVEHIDYRAGQYYTYMYFSPALRPFGW